MLPTPAKPREWIGTLTDAHRDVTGSPPLSREFLLTVAGIVGVENANGAAFIQNNVGNLMAGPEWQASGRDYWPHPKPEEGQPAFFRAYRTLRDGARDFWRLLYRKFPAVIRAAVAANSDGMVRALYRDGYVVGGSEDRYLAAAASLTRSYWREGLGRQPAPPVVAWLALVGFAGWQLWRVLK